MLNMLRNGLKYNNNNKYILVDPFDLMSSNFKNYKMLQ